MLQRCEKCKRIYNDINNKSCPFCKSNSEDLPNEYKKIEKKEKLVLKKDFFSFIYISFYLLNVNCIFLFAINK